MLRRTRVATMLATLAMPIAACAPGLMGHETPHVPGIRIIQREQARALSLVGAPYVLRFGDQQDGTKLVLDYLDQAKRAGARWVSDIGIVLLSRREREPVYCETRLLPFAKNRSVTVPQMKPGYTEQRSVLKPVTQTVTEYEYRCRLVTKPVSRMETSYEYQYDYASRASRMVPVTRYVTRYEGQQECSSQPVTRTVTRYEYQMESHYVPPRLEYIAAHFTDFDLIQDHPRCRPARQAMRDGSLPHYITGTIYREGSPP